MKLLAAYNIVLYVLLLCGSPYLLFRALFDRKFRPILKRFGPYPTTIPAKGLWIHAVSVGEVAAAKALVFALKERFPQIPLVLTTSTTTGQDVAQKTLGERGVFVTYFPFDIPFAVKRALSSIRPRALILLEAELWPNVIRHAAARGVPVILLNGRISALSAKRYRFGAPLVRSTLREFDAFGMRTAEDAHRITQLGGDPSKVDITGNIKFEASLLSLGEEQKRDLAFEMGLRENERLIVAGSTHPGDEQLILDVFMRLRERIPAVTLLLAPRHVGRVNEVCDAVRRTGLEFVLRTDKHGADEKRQVIILNTMGELPKLYALGEMAIVGKSFAGAIGGHNPLEPAAAGIPVLFGPHMENFADIVELLRSYGGCIQVRDTDELYQRCLELLSDPLKRKQVGQNAQQVLISGAGALAKSLGIIEKVLRTQVNCESL